MSQQVSTKQYTALMRLAHERLAARFAAARTNAEYAAVQDDVYACVPMDDSFMIAYQANTPLRIHCGDTCGEWSLKYVDYQSLRNPTFRSTSVFVDVYDSLDDDDDDDDGLVKAL